MTALPRVEQSSLGIVPVRGPFSQYLNRQETAILVALVNSVKPKVMIEFGCNVGITAKRVLENVPTLERYVGIDVPSDHKPVLACQLSEVPDYPGCHAALDERFFLLKRERLLMTDDLEPCDVAFIDGDHSAEMVKRDSYLACALLRKGGVVVWHDAGNESVEVTPVLERLLGFGWPIQHVEGSWLAFMRL
jgi:predicted O-methyltransferase YrrM